MTACWCSLAGTAACQHCRNNPMATDVWTNKPNVAVDHVEAKPFGNGLDVCPVCGKPTTIGKPQTNADRIRSMTDEELAKWFGKIQYDTAYFCAGEDKQKYPYPDGWLDWLKEEKADEL